MSSRRAVAAPDPDRPEVLIGGKLRATRKARAMTLDQVAHGAGLTKGFVSRLERDDVSPSVASLVKVCEVLGLRVGELFDPPDTAVTRAGEGRRINFGGTGAEERLITPGTQAALEVIHAVVEPAGNGGAEQYVLDCDVECAYVVRGVIQVILEQETITLHPGDALTFPGRTPHTWRNTGDQPCELLWMLAPAP